MTVLQSSSELINALKSLVPISNLSQDNIEAIANYAKLNKVAAKDIIFNEGESDAYVYYLLKGKLELIAKNNTNFYITAGTDDACYPLAQFQPRQYTARAMDESIVLLIDRDLLDSFLVDHGNTDNGVEVNDIDNDENVDWMTRILQSPLFSNIPVENIQKIFSKIESLDVRQDDVIIKQGDEGDYYYIIQNGRCRVSRKPTPRSQAIHLAELREGDAFGEEAIIARLKRNASVTMASDGRLMRLAADDFRKLILKPILQQIKLETANEKIKQGAVWLDVRYPDEYRNTAFQESINIPLNLLRLQLNQLDITKQYISVCDTGSRSAIAAYILGQHGYKAYQLDADWTLAYANGETCLPDKDDKSGPSNCAKILPFKQILETDLDNNVDDNIFSDDFKSELGQLREELCTVREKLKELMQIKSITAGLRKSLLNETEKKLKEQQERMSQQAQNTDKLVQQVQQIHSSLEQEKELFYKEIKKQRQQQAQSLAQFRTEMEQRLRDEEKKMQDFYAWKGDEIERIKQMKSQAERKYLMKKNVPASPVEDTDVAEQLQVRNAAERTAQAYQNDEKVLNMDLEQWLSEQLEDTTSPVNLENVKREE